MTDLLALGAIWLAEQRRRFLSRTVTYERTSEGVVSTADVPATIGRTVFRFDSGYGADIRFISRDFLIATTDLVLDGQATEPKRGDRIRETVGPITYVYEVIGPGGTSSGGGSGSGGGGGGSGGSGGGGEPDWRYSDNERTTFRIHTKQTGQETKA